MASLSNEDKACAEVGDQRESNLYFDLENTKLPIVYRDEYNIKLCGFEKLHPFDAGKWGNVYRILKGKNLIDKTSIIHPNEANTSDLCQVHTKSYIRSLKWSFNVAKITEIPIAAFVPNMILQRKVLTPFRYQTGGSVIAGKCAIERGWGINIGGGFHHCSKDRGGGFCAYADITIAINYALSHFKHITRVMIVDLDAHQGNGHERDFYGRDDVYILDVYNKLIYPNDTYAKEAISRRVELMPHTTDEEYLDKVSTQLEGALNEFRTHLVVYNAGTDILKGDPLGLLDITDQGIIMRDEIVFSKVRKRGIPIMMVTSGGYQRVTANIIAESISNLHYKGLISLKQNVDN